MTRFVRSAALATAALLVASSCNVERPIAPRQIGVTKYSGGAANAVLELVRYEFTGNQGANVTWPPTTVAPGITASVFSRGPGLTAASAGDAFNSSSWSLTALDANDYVEFSVTQSSPFTVTELSFAQQRSSTGPVNWQARLVRPDGSMGDIFGGPSTTVLATVTVPIPALEQGPYTGTVRIRIYAWGGSASGGTFRQDNVVLRGDPGGAVTPTVAHITVEPATATVEVGATQQFTATAFDASNNPIPGTTFTWSSSAAATVNSSGLATGASAGDATITATAPNLVAGTATLHVNAAPPPPPPADVVISQIYGGGGNAGSVLKNDFIEIFNRGNDPVNLTGWSVQYISANGNGTWAATPLTGTLAPHSYYLVQEAAGTGGTVNLPTPDATGSIAMGAAAGKIILASQAAALTGACPTTNVIDRVAYGVNTGADNCATPWGGRTEDASATIAVFRLMDGCLNTQKSAFDFLVQTAAPRNSSNTKTCPAPSTASIVINEILAEPFHATGGASWGEWFEVKNTGATPIDLMGWTITTQGQPSHTIASSFVVPAGGIKVLGRGSDLAQNGGVTIDYNYFVGGGSATNFLDPRDFILLTDAAGGLADFARWTTTTAFVLGTSRGVKVATDDNMDVGGANWGYSTTQFGDGDFGTPGAENGVLAETPSVFPNTISITGRHPTGDPALPVGYEDQIFGQLNLGTGGTQVSAFTWLSLTPAIASIDADGVIRGLAPGSATFRATAAFDGTTTTITLPVAVATLGGTAQYANNAEFGEPADGNPADDFIVRRAQYTSSYSNIRNTPNWVSYNIDASHFGPQDRCDCFTHDDTLPASFLRINTADYTGAGAFHGYGIDRGHLARSFDRTTGTLDNATTFLFTNIIPQAGKLNQQQWGDMETYLGDLARFSNKEVYVVTGVAGSKGTIKNEGKLTIPAHVWKVAVIMPRDRGLADVHNYTDVEVIAVSVPNDSTSILPWQTNYVVTVDSVEALSGYDLLALLPDHIEAIVEANIKPPLGAINGPFSANEGSSVSMSGAGSTDPNGTVVSYAWTFGDGGTATGANVSHVYTNNGTYTVILTVTDNDGLTNVVTTTATIANVAPSIAFIPGGTRPVGSLFTASSSFTDPGDDTWTATVNYGDGTGTQPLALVGKDFTISHAWATPGNHEITVTISDGTTTSSRSGLVTVMALPVANIASPITGIEGSAVTMSGAGSTDADGFIVNYAWTFGDGGTGTGVSVSHTYAAAGAYVVTLTVRDDHGNESTTSTTAIISALTPTQRLDALTATINQLVAGGSISAGNGNSLKSKIESAIQQLAKGNVTPARNQLNALLNEIDAMRRSGRLSATDAAALTAAVQQVLALL
jgi:DNA/RNA endonuclease G (NUC1)